MFNWQELLFYGILAIAYGISLAVGLMSKSKVSKIFLEVSELYKKLEEQRKDPLKYAQSFTPYEDDYVYDPSTKTLVKLDVPKNVQEKIDSYVDCALERILDKYLGSSADDVVDDPAEEYSATRADLSLLGEALETAEDYRDRYELPEDWTYSQIFEEVNRRSQSLKEQLSKLNKKKEELIDEKKT